MLITCGWLGMVATTLGCWRRRYLFVDTDSEGREGIEEGDIVFKYKVLILLRTSFVKVNTFGELCANNSVPQKKVIRLRRFAADLLSRQSVDCLV
jgi:hypothetical protein